MVREVGAAFATIRALVTSRARYLVLPLAALLCAGALSACGNSVPGNAVARVSDAIISKASFDHWLTIANASPAPGTPPGQHAPVPDSPSFANCIAFHQANDPKPPTGTPAPTAAVLRASCEQQYVGLRNQVMQFLISADWLQGEANDQGVKVTSAAVLRTFNQVRQQQFPNPGQFQAFETQSGMTIPDLLFRVRLNMLSSGIEHKVVSGKTKVSASTIASYFSAHQSLYTTPERRDLHMVLAKTLAIANKAKSLLAQGQSFKSVASKYSQDVASRSQGGVLLSVARGGQEPAFDAAISAAPLHKVEGPVKTTLGYYVFEVDRIAPVGQQTLAEASPSIQQQLSQQQQQKALQDFVKQFNSKWRSRTNCRSGFVVPSCSNGPKPPAVPSPTGAATGAPPAQSQAPPSNSSGTQGGG